MTGSTPPVDVLSPARDRLGEGPWWSVREQLLYWVDSLAPALQRSALDGSDHRRWPVPSTLGSAVPTTSGDVLLALRDGLGRLDLRSGEVREVLALEEDRPGQHFNDGACDPRGRFWFGSMHDEETEPLGSLYRYEAGGRCTRVLTGITTSNGLGWSPDGGTFYYTDSIARRIWSFAVGEDGSLSDRRDFAQDPPGWVPDGLTVDAEGFVWSAKWDGARVVRYAPDGRVDRVLHLPVRRPTSCAFAGPHLDALVVTSASVGVCEPSPQRLDGAVLLLDPGARGLPETPFAG